MLALLGRLPARRRLGAGLGRLALLLSRRRAHIARVNLRLTQPALSADAREQLLRRHFAALGHWLMDMLWALSASRDAINRYVRIEGEAPAACILAAPHFVGLDLALLRLNGYFQQVMAYHYKPLHNRFWDRLINGLRQRFGSIGFSTRSKHSLLAAVRHCRRGGVLCYLPDIETRGRKSTVYVPFMAVEQAATTSGLSRLAKAARVPVVLCIVCRDESGYLVKLLPLADFPGDDELADAARLNALIAEQVQAMPENYFWLHRRFKTDEHGKTAVYD